MAYAIGVTDAQQEILKKVVTELFAAKLTGGKKTIELDMTCYTQPQLLNLKRKVETAIKI